MSLRTQLQANNTELQNHLADIMNLPDIEDLKKGEYVWKKLTAKDGDFYSYVTDNDPNKYPNGGIGYDDFYYELYGTPYPIVSWADGTDEEIVAMIQAADEGKINLYDYWAVGQERKVTLKAMNADKVEESHVSQQVTFVLMNKGGRNFSKATPSGRKECSFIVGMKNSLKEEGQMHWTMVAGGWRDCDRRSWCNSTFKNSIPDTLLPIFKQFANKTASGGDGGTAQTTDWFALPSEKEVFGSNTYGDSKAEANFVQIEYYKTAARRKKKYGNTGSVGAWWLGSRQDIQGYFCDVEIDGTPYAREPDQAMGISPYGCI